MLFWRCDCNAVLARKNPGCNAFLPFGSIDCNAQLQCSIAMPPESPQIEDLAVAASIPTNPLISALARRWRARIVDLGIFRTDRV